MGENNLGKRVLTVAFRLFRLVWAWIVKFVKTRFRGCRRCKAQKNMDDRMKRLGAEIYSLHKQGETDFIKSTAVQQQLKLVEEAEAGLFEVYDQIEAIDNDYRRKKHRIFESVKPDEKPDDQ